MTSKQRDPRISALIDCGRAGDLSAISEGLFSLPDFDDGWLLTAAQNLHKWVMGGVISVEEIGPLAKSLVVAENYGLFRSGSTNSISRVEPLLSEVDRNWLFVSSSNPYVPFGSNDNCRHAPDVESYRKGLELRQVEAEQVKINSRVNAARKAYEGSCRRAEMQMQQAATSAHRDREMAALRMLSIADRVATIVFNPRPIHYFPEEFADIQMEDLRQIAPEIREHFAGKLARAKKGKWKRLFEMITEVNQ